MDVPGSRASHFVSVPTLGGIAIFGGVIFSIILWTPFQVFGNLQYILSAFVIIFLIGAKDDILPLTPYKKMLGQLIAVLILVFKANIRITNFYGIYGIDILPEWMSILFSIFTVLLIINAFNLIDGINTLCASTGILIAVTLGYWYMEANQIVLSIIAFSLVGSLIAFLKYNISPAKIFMGDTGSMMVGSICAILVIRFMEINHTLLPGETKIHATPALAIALLFIPLCDTLRVFILRLINGRSPFMADKNHIHHVFLSLGLNHLQTTSVLIILNALMIIMVSLFTDWGNVNLLILIVAFGLLFSIAINFLNKHHLKQPTY